MTKQKKAVRPSAYPGARLDSAAWRTILGASTNKIHAVAPHAPPRSDGPNLQRTGTGEEPPREHHLTFLQNFGLLGVPLLAVASTSIAWTTLLLVLNVAPNTTANYLMDTTEFDNGSFWLITDPSSSLIATAVIGLGGVLLGYVYAFLKMTWWQNEDLPDSNSQALMARITRALVREGGTRQQLLEFWSELTGFQGQRRKFWVGLAVLALAVGSVLSYLLRLALTVCTLIPFIAQNLCLKTVDILLQIISLERILELGFPTDLCYGYAALIAANALSCVFVILTPDRRSAFSEIIIDTAYELVTCCY